MSLLIMQPGNKVHNAMCKAIYSRDIDTVESIIDEYGVSHFRNWYGGSSLLVTALDCRYSDVARLLIAKGCSLLVPFSFTHLSRSMIHMAVKLGDLELVNEMLEKNKDLIRVVVSGETVLHVTAADGKGALVRLLMQRGAELDQQNHSGMTPLHLAAVHGHVEVLTMLLQAGASVKVTDNNGKSALFLATSSGHREAVKVLLEWGSDVNIKSNNGMSPLIDLTHKGFSNGIDIFRDLVAFGANINDKDSNGQTPLHMAVMLKNILMMDEILEGGGDVNAVDKYGMAPCDAVIKITLMGMVFFKDVGVAYVLGRFLMKLNEIGFYLNDRNMLYLDMFLKIYYRNVSDQLTLGIDDSQVVLKRIQEEVALMKTVRDNRVSVFSIMKKFKNSDTLHFMTQREIQLLESIDLSMTFPVYKNILKYLLIKSKYRNELLNSGQECLSAILGKSEIGLPVLPDEILTQVVMFLTNKDLLSLIKCTSRIKKHSNGN